MKILHVSKDIREERGQRKQPTMCSAKEVATGFMLSSPDMLFQDETGDQPVLILFEERTDKNEDTESHLKQK